MIKLTDQSIASRLEALLARFVSAKQSNGHSFGELLQNVAAEAQHTQATEAQSATVGKSSTAQTAPADGLALVTSISSSAAAAQTDPCSFFDRDALEQHMNECLIRQITQENEKQMDAYNLSMKGWETTCEVYRRVGKALPPQPPPPVLEKAEAKPPGGWFRLG